MPRGTRKFNHTQRSADQSAPINQSPNHIHLIQLRRDPDRELRRKFKQLADYFEGFSGSFGSGGGAARLLHGRRCR